MKRAAVPLILFLFGFCWVCCACSPCPAGRRTPLRPSPFRGAGGGRGEVPAFTSKDTTALLRSAAGVAEALKYKDYEALAGYVHPERGSPLPPTPR